MIQKILELQIDQISQTENLEPGAKFFHGRQSDGFFSKKKLQIVYKIDIFFWKTQNHLSLTSFIESKNGFAFYARSYLFIFFPIKSQKS
jgi:hypothetical protein